MVMNLWCFITFTISKFRFTWPNSHTSNLIIVKLNGRVGPFACQLSSLFMPSIQHILLSSNKYHHPLLNHWLLNAFSPFFVMHFIYCCDLSSMNHMLSCRIVNGPSLFSVCPKLSRSPTQWASNNLAWDYKIRSACLQWWLSFYSTCNQVALFLYLILRSISPITFSSPWLQWEGIP